MLLQRATNYSILNMQMQKVEVELTALPYALCLFYHQEKKFFYLRLNKAGMLLCQLY